MKRVAVLVLSALLTGGFLAPLASVYAGADTLPLVQSANLEYKGAFRLPRGGNGTTNGFSFGGNALAFDPANGSLFVSTRESWVGKIRVAAPAISSNIESLPFASMIQNIRDPLEGGLSALLESSIRGLLVAEAKLYGAASIFYDATNSARVSHFSRSTDLSSVSASPLKALWQADKSGYLGGWLTNVPSEWQSLLGGNVLSGNCCMPIVSRTSNGPAAFAWNTSSFASAEPVLATPLLYYTLDHDTLGPWGGSNEIYGATTVIGGMVIPNGTRSLLYFGLNGTGSYCYGTGGATGGECLDPISSDKGQHAYPYNYQVWAYNLNDLAAVKSGAKNPWDVTPYATWTLTFPDPFVSLNGIGGVAYDASNQLIYVSQAKADVDGYSSRSLIHVFKVNVGTAEAYPTPYATPYLTPYPTPEAAYATPYATPYDYETPYNTPYLTPYATPYGTPYSYPTPTSSTTTTGTTTIYATPTTSTTTATTTKPGRRKKSLWNIFGMLKMNIAAIIEAVKALFR